MQGIFLNVNDITLVLILLQKCRKMRNPGTEVVSPHMSLNPKLVSVHYREYEYCLLTYLCFLE